MNSTDIQEFYIYLAVDRDEAKPHGKDKTQKILLLIRGKRSERGAFITLCDRLDTGAAREHRFMREKVARHAKPFRGC